ncbi:isochorismatase [Leuconostoc suionicum]|uniref:isochorismatase n=1 Tax=Leuconostoc suionicum TaxID=1511761 RepID=UPI0032DF6958
MDFQKGICKEPQDIFNIQECVTSINSRITAYRHTHKPIIFIQHNDEKLIFGSI